MEMCRPTMEQNTSSGGHSRSLRDQARLPQTTSNHHHHHRNMFTTPQTNCGSQKRPFEGLDTRLVADPLIPGSCSHSLSHCSIIIITKTKHKILCWFVFHSHTPSQLLIKMFFPQFVSSHMLLFRHFLKAGVLSLYGRLFSLLLFL